MAQLVALMTGVVLGGVAEVVGSNLARGKIFTASIGSVDSIYSSVFIYCIYLLSKLAFWQEMSCTKICVEQKSNTCLHKFSYKTFLARTPILYAVFNSLILCSHICENTRTIAGPFLGLK